MSVRGSGSGSVSVCVHLRMHVCIYFMCKHTHLFYSIFVFSIIYLNELNCCNLKVTG